MFHSLQTGVIANQSSENFPYDIPGLTEWLNASKIVGSDGDKILLWKASIGQNAFWNGLVEWAPTLKTGINGINNKKVLLADGLSNKLEILLNISTYTELTWFIVFQNITDNSGSGSIIQLVNGAGVWWVGKKRAIFYDTDVREANWSFDTNPHVYSGTFKNSGTFNHLIDGISIGSGSFGTANYFSTNRIFLFCNRDSNGDWYHGKVGDILIYNKQLSTSNRIRIENYLKVKYRIL